MQLCRNPQQNGIGALKVVPIGWRFVRRSVNDQEWVGFAAVLKKCSPDIDADIIVTTHLTARVAGDIIAFPCSGGDYNRFGCSSASEISEIRTRDFLIPLVLALNWYERERRYGTKSIK